MDVVKRLKSAKSKIMDFTAIDMDESSNPNAVEEATILAANHLLGHFNDRVRDYILKPLPEKKLTIPSFAYLSSLSNSGDHIDYEMQIIQWSSDKNAQIFARNHFLLLDLVNVIKSSLENMTEIYIKELVFDPSHLNLVLLNKSQFKVIGGITYRPFPQQGFTEIAFAAVFSGTHSKGYGKLMMDRLKEESIKEGILYLLTFGDDKALGFFRKQGFRETIELPPEKYQGYIKTYDDATFIECKLNPLVNYSTLGKTIVAQKAIIDQMIIEKISKQILPKSICYTGEQKVVPLGFLRSVFPQCNFSKTLADFEDHSKQLTPKLKSVLDTLKTSAFNYFWEIKMSDAPELEHLPLRMDLKTVCERVHRRYYCNLWTFHAEMVWTIKTLEATIQKEPNIQERKMKLYKLKEFEKFYCNTLETTKLLTIINRRNIIVHSP